MRTRNIKSTIIALGVAFAFLVLIMLSILPQAWAEDDEEIVSYDVTVHHDYGETEEEEKPESICPKTLMSDSCLTCHTTPNFNLIESDPHEGLDLPYGSVTYENNVGYLYLTDIFDVQVKEFFDWLRRRNCRHAIIELHSYGGSLFDGYRIVGLMEEWQREGRIVETRCYGFAASAAFMILVSGNQGYRFVSSVAELMWHELLSWSMFKISTPSSTEDEAKILRHLQDTANSWITARCKLTKEELDKMTHRQEFWCNGKQATEYGFADGFIGE